MNISHQEIEEPTPWPKHVEDDLNYFSRASANWVYPLIRLATKRQLQPEDIPPAPKSQNVQSISKRFWDAFEVEKDRANKAGTSFSLVWTIFRAYREEFLTGYLCQLAFCVVQFAIPYFIADLVRWIADGTDGIGRGIYLALALSAVCVLSSVFMSFNLYSMRRTGLAVRTGTMQACYEHILQLSATARATLTVGKTTSMIAIDCEKLLMASMFTGYLWHGPLASLICMLLLAQDVGWGPAMLGLLTVCLLIPLQSYIGNVVGRRRRKMMVNTDERVKLSNEILGAIRAIKFYNWELPLAKRVFAVRASEMHSLFLYLCMNGYLRELLFVSGPLVALVIYTFYIYGLHKSMTLVQVMRVLSTLNVMRFPLNMLGQALKHHQDASVSCDRLGNFFMLPTRPETCREQVDLPFIAFEKATFSWTPDVYIAPMSAENATNTPKSDYSALPLEEEVTKSEDSNINEIEPNSKIQQQMQATSPNLAMPLHMIETSVKSKTFRLDQLTLNFGGDQFRADGGCLVAFIGSVGSGKSSLLQAILGEIPLCETHGTESMSPTALSPVTVRGQIVYCSQRPWIQNLTLRDNVLFGYELSEKDPSIRTHYESAIAAAAMLPDIELLRQKDLTEIGERGINLSGGQKARVAIARALFIAQRRANICLFDDPFSAVDKDTGTMIFHEGIRGILREKPRIVLVSLNSHLHLLPFFDRIIVLEEGTVVADGTPTELAQGQHAALLSSASGISIQDMVSMLESAQNINKVKPYSAVPIAGLKASEATSKMSEKERLSDGRIIIEEKREVGAVKWSVYLDYFSAALWKPFCLSLDTLFTSQLSNSSTNGNISKIGSIYSAVIGFLILSCLLLLFAVAQTARIAVDYSLAQWAQDLGASDSKWALVFYISFGILVLFCLIRSWYLNYWAWKSSRAVHERMFLSILQAPVTDFFDTHTVGEVLNKLSRDTEVTDSAVPEFLLLFCLYLMQVSFSFGICAWSSPYVAIAFVPMCYSFIRAGQLFSSVTRDLKRMESASHSPIYSSLSETLGGLDTIRAFSETKRFLLTHRKKMETNGKFIFHMWMCACWMTFRMEMASAILLVCVAALGVGLRDQTDPLTLGIALSYGIQLNSVFQRCVQIGIDVGVYMTNVERVLQYTMLPQEQSILPRPKETIQGVNDISDTQPSDNYVELVPLHKEDVAQHDALSVYDACWPANGSIEFRHVTFQYRDNPPALRDLSFFIHSGERIGICGRTGAGKSSIVFALFRMAGLTSGEILVGGSNITHDVPLALLRQRMAIIPQDPVLLTGSIRFALDPFDQYTDQQVWQALETVNLSSAIKGLSNGINELVVENGNNLSHGQRQLICIARALLRDARILVVDEGTSAVDPSTDKIIQAALRNASAKYGTTVLAIAHRLQTIQDFDKILVLGDGKLLEFDSPTHLLANPKSHFASMLQEVPMESNASVSTSAVVNA